MDEIILGPLPDGLILIPSILSVSGYTPISSSGTITMIELDGTKTDIAIDISPGIDWIVDNTQEKKKEIKQEPDNWEKSARKKMDDNLRGLFGG